MLNTKTLLPATAGSDELTAILVQNPAAKLSWDDTPARQAQVLAASRRVYRTAGGIWTQPARTPSLLEQMGVTSPFSTARGYVSRMGHELAAMRAHRLGTTVEFELQKLDHPAVAR